MAAEESGASLCVGSLNQHISGAQYSEHWGLADFVSKMMVDVAAREPVDPYIFMMKWIAANRPPPPTADVQQSEGQHRVNITACARKPVRKLLEITLEDLGWAEQVSTPHLPARASHLT